MGRKSFGVMIYGCVGIAPTFIGRVYCDGKSVRSFMVSTRGDIGPQIEHLVEHLGGDAARLHTAVIKAVQHMGVMVMVEACEASQCGCLGKRCAGGGEE